MGSVKHLDAFKTCQTLIEENRLDKLQEVEVGVSHDEFKEMGFTVLAYEPEEKEGEGEETAA